MSVIRWLTLSFLGLWASLQPASAQTAGEFLRRELEAGHVAKAVAELKLRAASEPDARMALGFAQFGEAIEHLVQGLYRYGLKTPTNPFLPVLRLPIPQNGQAEPLDYAKLRALYQTFLDDLSATRATLAAYTDTAGVPDTKLVLDLNAIRFALQPGDTQKLLGLPEITAAIGGRPLAAQQGGAPSPVEKWEVAFDRADAFWLAGYTHILSAGMEFVMAHDWKPTFEATGYLFFSGAKLPDTFVAPDPRDPNLAMTNVGGGIADQIALLHLIHWPAGDKTRMSAARLHFKSAIALSRQTWQAVMAETGDDREWLPSPRQRSRANPGLPVTDEMVAGWLDALDDFDAVLDGRKLLGHWRFNKGIDMRMFFEEPQPFDLVLWATGHGAVPFLKDGPTLGGSAVQRWNAIFRNNFLGYAFFIN